MRHGRRARTYRKRQSAAAIAIAVACLLTLGSGQAVAAVYFSDTFQVNDTGESWRDAYHSYFWDGPWQVEEVPIGSGDRRWTNCSKVGFGAVCDETGVTGSWVAVASDSKAYTIDVDIYLQDAGQQCKVIYTGANNNEDYRVDIDRVANRVSVNAPAGSANTLSWTPPGPITGNGTKYHLRVVVTKTAVTVHYAQDAQPLVALPAVPTSISPDGKVGVGTFAADCDFDNFTVTGAEGIGNGVAKYIPVFGYERTEGCNEGPANPIQGETMTELQCDRPLFAPWNRDHDRWWDVMVEEMEYANIEIAAVHNRGCFTPTSLDGPGDMCPNQLTKLTAALARRASPLKIAMFDDFPTLGADYKRVTGNNFDLGNAALREEWLWDKRWKPFYDKIGDLRRAKIDGRPLIFIWSVDTSTMDNPGGGNLRDTLKFLREKVLAESGQNPFIVVDAGFWGHDAAALGENVTLPAPVGAVPAVDAISNWWRPDPPTTGVGTRDPAGPHNGYLAGTIVPAFRDWKKIGVPEPRPIVGQPGCGLDCREVLRRRGHALVDYLEHHKAKQSNFVLLEGWTNVIESAGYYRSLEGNDPHGCTQAGEENRSVYPSQSIHIVRRYADPTKGDVTIEAETADAYEDSTLGNTGGAYRPSNYANSGCATTYNDIDVGETETGYYVGWTEWGEWIGWRDLYLPAGTYHVWVRYATPHPMAVLCAWVNSHLSGCGDEDWLTATGGFDQWAEVKLTDIVLKNGLHDLDISIEGDDAVNIDRIRLVKD
jgi:hypothetical protein